MERGRSKHRRGGGGGRRPYRGRGSGGDREFVHRGHRDVRGPPEPEKEEENDAAKHQENDEQSSEFSRRKILSNWDRYEEAAKETESEVVQRGTDYGVLLSSAGDSFTQFRFADEKGWTSENLGNTPDSCLYLETQSLVSALHNLPLHLRLNVEADLVQEELPQELPQFLAKAISNVPVITAQEGRGASVPSENDAAPQPETKTSPEPSLPAHDEELDFLLSLKSPATEKAVTCPDGIREPDQNRAANSPLKDEPCEADEEKPKAMTSEDLEDWLDSMIS
ncbi:cell death regulator Aven isoform 2-T2 [Anomaloglossus baeobatrachus]|uniref:cell death regulator Aven isoform X2 n=1 Tax=Anomaloglossus baeobatrachus TaxID=238106 RepID=UPI003F508F1D